MSSPSSESQPLLPSSTPVSLTSKSTQPLYNLPIPARPPPSGLQRFIFPLFFVTCLILIDLFQIIVMGPLALMVWLLGMIRLRTLERLLRDTAYERLVMTTKGWFGSLLIAITVLFAPTTITLTSDSTIDLNTTIIRPRKSSTASNGNGKPASTGVKKNYERLEIDLPERVVIMANHQAYTDWIYIWILGHLTKETSTNRGGERSHGSKNIIILLKRSLKWVPIIGWGMQFYDFIFLNRSWAADRSNLTRALTHLGQRARLGGGLWLLIFPEGTITSDEERAKSLRYATKEGVPDFVNCLHPRSTGLLFALRTLIPEVNDLKILDITIGYPGVPRGGYAQEWYNLTSVFSNGVPPPSIHLHLRMIDPFRDGIPGLASMHPASLSNDSSNVSKVDPDAERVQVVGLASPEEATSFNLWLRRRWDDKEQLLNGFVKMGHFKHTGNDVDGGSVVMPIAF